MMKVIQAAGRIFRTSTDRGFVMLIGHRFSIPYYKSVLPTDWNIEHAPNLIKRIQTFWATQNADLREQSRMGQGRSVKPKMIQKKYPKTADLFDFMEKL
ncbi:hypothetical protein ES703_65182 [subsurface metagenome]